MKKTIIIAAVLIIVLLFIVPELWAYILTFGGMATAGQIKSSQMRQSKILQELDEIVKEGKDIDKGVEEKTSEEEADYWKDK